MRETPRVVGLGGYWQSIVPVRESDAPAMKEHLP